MDVDTLDDYNVIDVDAIFDSQQGNVMDAFGVSASFEDRILEGSTCSYLSPHSLCNIANYQCLLL